MTASLLAEIEATCAIFSWARVWVLAFLSASMIFATPMSMPRLRDMGLAPAAMFFTPSV
ncbi:hypothetical protein D3C83_330020 [compost metagenome]